MNTRVFRWPHRVSYAECTLGDHVFHARYLDILDRARGEFFRELGHPLHTLQGAGFIFVVTDCHLHYKAAARYDDELLIEIRVQELARISLRLGYRVLHRAGRLLVEADLIYGCTTVENRLQRLPAELRAALLPFLRQEPASG